MTRSGWQWVKVAAGDLANGDTMRRRLPSGSWQQMTIGGLSGIPDGDGMRVAYGRDGRGERRMRLDPAEMVQKRVERTQ